MMSFARFAKWYIVSLAVMSIGFTLLVSPFLGVHWSDWLIAGSFQILIAMLLVGVWAFNAGIVIINLNVDDAPPARSIAQRTLTVVLPTLALLTTFASLAFGRPPGDAWSLVSYLLWVASIGVVTPLIFEDDSGKINATRFDSISITPCDVTKCTERSVYVMAIRSGSDNNVAFDLCLDHHTEFGSERKQGKLDTYADVMSWVRNEAPRSRDTGARRT